MNISAKTLFSASLGAAAMYYLDPARGRYRRALFRDQIVHGGHKATHGATVVGRDSRNRALGLLATLRSRLFHRQPDDVVLVQRVRACLGRAVTHPHSIKVEATDGTVTLSGPILEEEVPLLIDCTLGIAGVRDLKNDLDVHAEAGNVPGLQGTPRQRPGQRSAFMQTNWSPTARTVAGLGGALAAYHGLVRRNPGGTLLGAAGLLVLARAATNIETRRLLGIGVPRHAVDVQKSIRINAPVEKVFAVWDRFDNFPWFMRHVRQVHRIQTNEAKDRWRWTVTGPTGTEFDFDSVVTARQENRLIAWRTEGEALVRHAGRVFFQPHSDGSTTVDVKMQYNPVAGAVGHAVAWLLGADPRHQMDEDLLRMKSFLETGKLPRDAAEPAKEVPRTLKEHARELRSGGDGAEPELRRKESTGAPAAASAETGARPAEELRGAEQGGGRPQ